MPSPWSTPQPPASLHMPLSSPTALHPPPPWLYKADLELLKHFPSSPSSCPYHSPPFLAEFHRGCELQASAMVTPQRHRCTHGASSSPNASYHVPELKNHFPQPNFVFPPQGTLEFGSSPRSAENVTASVISSQVSSSQILFTKIISTSPRSFPHHSPLLPSSAVVPPR